jgi:hypothetical protein
MRTHLESLLERRQSRLDILKQETLILEEQIRSISTTLQILVNEDAQLNGFLNRPKVTMISDEITTTGKKLSKKSKTPIENKANELDVSNHQPYRINVRRSPVKVAVIEVLTTLQKVNGKILYEALTKILSDRNQNTNMHTLKAVVNTLRIEGVVQKLDWSTYSLGSRKFEMVEQIDAVEGVGA